MAPSKLKETVFKESCSLCYGTTRFRSALTRAPKSGILRKVTKNPKEIVIVLGKMFSLFQFKLTCHLSWSSYPHAVVTRTSALNGWAISVPPETAEWLPTGGQDGGGILRIPASSSADTTPTPQEKHLHS